MELLEEFMFASLGQLSQLAYEASISNAPNASVLAKRAAAAYAASLPLVSLLADRDQQPRLDPADAGLQGVPFGAQVLPGQPVLVFAGAGDRPGPPQQ